MRISRTTVLAAALFASSLRLAAQFGSVSAATPEAANAGRDILARGGNAADATVAVGFVLAVTEPAMSGLGAGTQVILQVPMHDPIVLNGTTFAPAATPASATSADLTGRRKATIPTSVRVLHTLWKDHGSGTIPWADLVAPAIRYAEEGFTVGQFRASVWKRTESDLRTDPATAAIFLKEGKFAYVEGDIFRQPILGRTLRAIAERGADDFYSGGIAGLIAKDMAANGGWISKKDLASLPPPRTQTPLKTTYRGWDVYSVPPPAGGWVMLQALNILEQSKPEDLKPGSPIRDAIIPRALMLAHTRRQKEPVRDMVNHQAETSARLAKERAAELWAGRDSGGETTHYSVIDANGMAIAVTTSINAYFGARVASPELGFLYNDYMVEFEFEKPDHPFALRAGGMPLSSMSATLVSKDRRAHLALGSPGSARIISAVAQVVQLWSDGHADIADAVAAPRWHAVPPDRYYPETQALANALAASGGIEGASFPEVPIDLMQNGRNAYWGGVHAVTWNKGLTSGAADPRRDGIVASVESGGVAFPAHGPGRFIFIDPMGREVPVWYWAPADAVNAPVHFVFTGVNRNADDYRDQWIGVAKAKNILLVVPEFTTKAFPGSRSYNNGNLYSREGAENPREEWSFSDIEPLFDAVRERFGCRAMDYTIYGHSAGSQFAHRFLMHVPGARVRQAVFANAGSYTFPWPEVDYPHGLRGARVNDNDLRLFFGRRVTVLLGDADTDPNNPSLDRSPNAMLQGAYRFARGNAYFKAVREHAEKAGWAFNWEMQYVPGVAHSNTLMAPPAGEVLFPAK